MEVLSRVHARNLVAWAKDKPEVIVFSFNDTTSTEIDLFRETYPDRFFSLGMAEQNMMSFAGGKVMMTAGVAALPEMVRANVLLAVSRFDTINAAAICAHYGSVSAVTFSAAIGSGWIAFGSRRRTSVPRISRMRLW